MSSLPETPNRVALYLRVSSEEQRDRETIELQREFLANYCELYGFEAAETYADDGVSGTIPLHERVEGKRLLDDAKAGRFDTVLVYKLDRLGRSLLVIVDAHDRLEAAGVSLRSATEPIDTSNPSGRLIFQMLASFAEYERETIAERTQAGLHRALRNGRHMGPPPFGYRADEDGRLEVVAEEAEVVREVISNIAGGSTLYAETRRLNDLGVRPPSWKYSATRKRSPAKKWRAPTIRAMVRQGAYSGVRKVKLATGEVVEQIVPAIVESEVQERALAQLEENRRNSGGRPRRRYPLSGLITCAQCGSSCVGRNITSGGKKYPYYRCNDDDTQRLHRAPRGHAPYVRAEWLEETVWADVRRFLENPGEVLERVRAQSEVDSLAEELASRHADLSKRLAEKHSEKDRYVHLYAQGHISESELETYLADLKNQTDNLRLLLEAIETDLGAKREEVELAASTEAWLLSLQERVHEVEGDSEEAYLKRRQLVRLLVAGITAGRDEDGRPDVRITYRFGPPEGDLASPGEEAVFVNGVQNSLAAMAGKASEGGRACTS